MKSIDTTGGRMLHVFRNTPLGRETLMMSGYFARTLGIELCVYVPAHNQFLMHFDHTIATIELDSSFLRSPGTARDRAEQVLAAMDVKHSFLRPDTAAANLPALSPEFAYMTCPRSIVDLSSKISLGHIGPGVRKIVRHASFPVLLPPTVARPWKSVVCFYGGSASSGSTLGCASEVAARGRLPLRLFTFSEGRPRAEYEHQLTRQDLEEVARGAEWIFNEGPDFREALYDVPHDALVVISGHGRGLARELLFKNRAETVQSVLPNQLLLVGPAVRPRQGANASGARSRKKRRSPRRRGVAAALAGAAARLSRGPGRVRSPRTERSRASGSDSEASDA